ncbi:MAG TPA: hypothetical protein VGO69_03535 [Pyrinomonadaceae bacterium]|jgi:hypothetical protein|nr:hypothetical protein [Pyrinomonadaceae bacterium]
MLKKATKGNESAKPDADQRFLKKALIAFAIIEALVTIPLMLYKIFG